MTGIQSGLRVVEERIIVHFAWNQTIKRMTVLSRPSLHSLLGLTVIQLVAGHSRDYIISHPTSTMTSVSYSVKVSLRNVCSNYMDLPLRSKHVPTTMLPVFTGLMNS